MRLLILFISLYSIQSSWAKTIKNNESVVSLKNVVVVGTVPGPDLWKVSKNGNTLWILGTLSPLPRNMKWNSKPIESVIKNSQVLLLPPTVSADIGFFKTISLATSAIGIKKNPDKLLLKDMLPAEMYTRWLTLKNKFLKNNKRIEKQRPIFASQKLFEKALKKSNLKFGSDISKKVKRIAKKHGLNIIKPQINIELNKPKAAIKKLKKTKINDLECFSNTLDRIEFDLEHMKSRAIAWSYGDIERIKASLLPDENKSCSNAILNSEFAQELGIENIPNKWRQKWLQEAIKTLSEHQSSFAILPISQLLTEGGLLESLREEGYLIEAPNPIQD